MQRRTAGEVTRLTLAMALMIGALVAGARPVDAAGVAPVEAAAVPLAVDAGSSIVSVVPARVFESRQAVTVDGLFAGVGRVGAGQFVEVGLLGRGGVPASGVGAVVMNVTAVSPSGPGFATVYPCGSRPEASSLNYAAGDVVANEVIAKLSGSGSVCVYSFAETDLLIDVVGYVPVSSSVASVVPARVFESRAAVTVDGLFAGVGRVGAGRFVEVALLGRGGVPGSGVGAVVMNVTAVSPSGPGFATVYPCGSRPEASSLNYATGDVVANEVIAKLSGSGSVCVYSFAETDLLIDVVGYVPVSSSVASVVPARVFESRQAVTVDGLFAGVGRVGAGQFVEVGLLGRGGVPASGVGAVVMNVTAVSPSGPGFATVYPCGSRPEASSLNYAAGDVVANEVIAKLSGSGSVCVYSFAETDLLIDVVGYVPVSPPTAPPVSPPPPPPPPPIPSPQISYLYEPGWHLEPSAVMFAGANESARVRLVHIGADGKPSGRVVPAGTTLIRSTPSFGVSTVSPGVYDISSGDRIGAELLAVDIPGEEATVPFWVTGVRVQPGVALIDADQVVLPPPGGADASSTGPFSVAELRARSNIDTAGSARLAHVFSGAVPPPGTIVVAGGSTSVVGRIIEPPGLPALTRDGLTLVTIELVGLDDAFVELDVDVDFTEAQEAGVFGTVDDRLCFNIDEPDCDQVIDSGSPGPSGLTGALTSAPDTSAPRLPASSPLGDACEVSASFAAGENKAKFDRSYRYLGGLKAAVAGGIIENIELTFGLGGTVSASLEGKILATLGLGLECLLYQFNTPDIPIPPPLGAFLSAVIEPGIKLSVPIEVSAGPGVKYKASNSITFEGVVGVRYVSGGTFVPINRSRPTTFDPQFEITPVSGGFDGLGPVAEVEFKPGLFLNALVGIRLGGKTAEWLGRIFSEDEFGTITPFEANLGPRLDVAWENQASVIKNKKSATNAQARVVFTVAPNTDALQGVMEILGGGSFNIGLPELELGMTFPRPVLKAKEPEAPTVEVLGEVTDTVALEDVVDVEIKVKDPDPSPLIDTEFSGSVDTYVRTSSGDLAESDFFRWSTTGNTATASAIIDADKCVRLGETGTTFTAAAVMTALGGLVRFPVYLGEFTIKCDRDVEFVPGELGLSKQTHRKTVEIEQTGYDGESWNIVIADGQAMPDDRSVLVVPSGGTFVRDETPEVDFVLTCDDNAYSVETVEYWLMVGDGGISAASLFTTLNCSEDNFEINEDRVTAGAAITFDTRGSNDDEWTATGPVRPGTGFLRGEESDSTEQSVLSAVTFDPRTPPITIVPVGCSFVELRGPLPEATIVATLTTTTRGSDSVIVDLPARAGDPPPPPGPPCPPPPPPPPNPPGPPGGPGGPGGGSTGGGSTGRGWGDPHLTTFDGQRFSSHAVGDYVLAEKIDGTTGPRLVGRFDYTAGQPGTFSPTSVIAVGIEDGDLDIELYTYPSRMLLINGVEQQLRTGVPTEVAPGVIITRNSSGGHDVSMADMYVSYTGINLAVTVGLVGGFGGMLGTNNQSSLDDIVIRDPAAAPASWSRLTLEEARQQGVRANEWAASWRITERSESPLSLPFDRFDAISAYSLDPVALAPFRAQAATLLGGVAELCSGTDAPDSYAIDIFAIELAIGTNPELLGCEFEVHGRVVTDTPATPAVGAEVVVDAPGLMPCETVTGRAGGYTCTMRVDVDEAAALDIEFPLDATIEASGVGAATPGATAVHTFDERAPLTDITYHRVDDIVLPIDQTVAIELSGTLTALGAPFSGSTGLSATARNAAGEELAAVSFDVTAVSGNYERLIAFPLSTTEVEWVWKYGIDGADHPRSTSSALIPGLNQATFDATYAPPIIELSGTVLYNGEAPTSVVVTVVAARPGGRLFTQRVTVVPAADGTYRAPFLVPVDTTAATASARLGYRRNALIEASVASPVPGPNPLTFDIVQDAPVLNVSGNLLISGASAPNTTFVARWSGRQSEVTTAIVDQTDGSYAIDFDLPVGVTDATIEAYVGVVRAEYPTVAVTGIVNGSNPVRFDVDAAPPVLSLSGTASAGGVPIDESFRLVIETADGSFRRSVTAVVNAAGEFSTQLRLPVGTTTVDVTAQIGDSSADWDTITLTDLVGGPNIRLFDPTLAAVGLLLEGVLLVEGGLPPGGRYIRIVSFDAADAVLDSVDVAVNVASNGTYAEPVQVAAGTSRIEVTALIGPYRTLRPSQSFSVLPSAPNPILYSTDVRLSTLRVSGTLTAGGRFLSGPVVFRTTFDLPDGTTTSVLDTAIVNGFDGTYSFDRLVPEIATAASVSALTNVNPSENVTVPVVLPPLPGVVPVNLSGDPAIPVTIDFTGVLSEYDGPFTGTTDIRYVLRENDGDVVADVTRTVTTDQFGQYRFALQTESAVTEMSVAWLVGVEGEPPAFETVDNIRLGTNRVSIANVYAPATVEITGTATLNGAPIDDDITIDLSVTGGSAPGFTQVVATDPATGVFTFTRTLERGATAVGVTATTTDPDNSAAIVSGVALVGGPNRIDLDIDVARTNLQVSGVMNVSGAVPPGLVDVRVIAKADGRPHRTTTFEVDPADDGGYNLELLLPHWATSVEVVAETSARPSDWPRITFTDLLAGDDARTFDATSEIQVLNISGNLGMRTTPFDEPWRLSIALLDESGGFVRFLDSSIRIEPDALGNWSIEGLETPVVASSVRLEANTSFGLNTREVSEVFAVGTGANNLVFNGNIDTVGLKISGNLLDDGEPATASRTLNVRAYTDATNFTFATRPTGVPDVNGDFQVGLLQFPGNVVRVEIGTNNTSGVFVNDEIWQSFDLVDGLNRVTFDEDYNPPVVTVSGNLQVDGVPKVGPTLLDVTWRQFFPGVSGFFPQNRSFTAVADENGDFSTTIVGPRQSTSIEVKPTIGVRPDEWPSFSLHAVAAGPNTLSNVDVDYDTTSVQVSGTAFFGGAPAPSRSATISSYDADGRLLGTTSTSINPDPTTGAYTTSVSQVYSDAAEIQVFVRYSFASQVYKSALSPRLAITQGSIANTVTFDIATTSITLNGSVTSGGVPQANQVVPIVIAAYDGTTLLDGQVLDGSDTLNEFIVADGSGNYSEDVFLPVGTNRVVVTPSFGDAAPLDFTTVTTPGVTPVPFDIASTGGGVAIAGSLTVEGAPASATPTVEVVSFDDGDGGDGPADVLPLGGAAPAAVTYDGSDGTFTAAGEFDAAADFLQVIVTFAEAPSLSYIRNFDIRGLAPPYALDVDVDHRSNRLELSPRAEIVDRETAYDPEVEDLTDQCRYPRQPFVYDLTLRALDGQAFEPGSNELDSETFLMLPNPEFFDPNRMFDVVWALPDGTVDVEFIVSTNRHYPNPDIATAEYGYRYDLGTIIAGGVSQVNDYVSADCNPETGGG